LLAPHGSRLPVTPSCYRLRTFVVAALTALGVTLAPMVARAADICAVRSGNVIFYFNVPLLQDLGIDLTVAGQPLPDQTDMLIQSPRWGFAIRPGSDFRFRAEHGNALAGGSTGGSLLLDADLTMRDRASGAQNRVTDFEIIQVGAPGSDGSTPEDGPPIVLRSRSTGLVFCELVSSMFNYSAGAHAIRVHYMNARISKQWAASIGRPDLAGWVIGGGEIRGDVSLVSSTPPSGAAYQPNYVSGFKDVKLGALSSIQQVGHIGTIPTGTTALTMATTSCNIGTVDVPWLAPMETDHPMIHMALYRLLNGRFEQIGISWMKHGFFAQSNTLCGSCPNPSDGSYLAIGCSDTYGVNNNADRLYLGPREEVNPYTGVWNCVGSYFSGGPSHQDCVDRRSTSGLSAIDHRLDVQDQDLALAGATYYYEADYVIRGDQDPYSNWGSRICTMSKQNNSSWTFSTPSSNNTLVNGPAVQRWGEMQTGIDVGPDDGDVMLSVQTTNLGGGMYHYEYALLNMFSDRRIRSFSVPVLGVSNITNIGFHDNDTDSGNDWQVSVSGGAIRWQTDTYDVDPAAPALEFGYMVNFRFDANAAPVDVNATLGIFKPGVGTSVLGATRGPANTALGVDTPGTPGTLRLIDIRPNPSNSPTNIAFELPRAVRVRLDIYDATGRLVRALVNDHREAGLHSASWDGKDTNGLRAAAGVYYARLQAADVTLARPLVRMK